ncbi:hypothetical protein [Streptomyces sp. BE230]|uniref:hypothetical protein n=1 Tax=Streptomyces sp. BE230 TaxID=3002526 RepID=UPI002ED64ACF|nr:hypothetical protein [Streptomyces sp. BE230]
MPGGRDAGLPHKPRAVRGAAAESRGLLYEDEEPDGHDKLLVERFYEVCVGAAPPDPRERPDRGGLGTSGAADRARVILASVGITVMAVGVVAALGADHAALVIGGVVWALLISLIPVMNTAGRRYRSRLGARLTAAGFTPVTDPSGRLRHLPPG